MKELFSMLQELIINLLSAISFLAIPVLFMMSLYYTFHFIAVKAVVSVIVMLASIYLNKSLH